MTRIKETDEVNGLRIQIATWVGLVISAVGNGLWGGEYGPLFMFLCLLTLFPVTIALMVGIIEYMENEQS